MWGDVFSGASQGAQVGGSVGGGWGAAIGAGIGALAGFGASNSAKKQERRAKNAIRERYQETSRQMFGQREQLLGRQRAGYAASGVRVDEGTPTLITAETQLEFSRAYAAAMQARKRELQGVGGGGNFWQAGLSALDAAGSIYSAFKTK